jgi:hypothetical protein
VVAALSDTVGVAHKPALDSAPDGLGPFVCTFDAIHCGAARTALLIVLRGDEAADSSTVAELRRAQPRVSLSPPLGCAKGLCGVWSYRKKTC